MLGVTGLCVCVQFVFVHQGGLSGGGAVALDDIDIRSGPCPQAPPTAPPANDGTHTDRPGLKTHNMTFNMTHELQHERSHLLCVQQY